MSEEGSTIDAGLEELTSDVLGPSADAQASTVEETPQPDVAAQEPVETQPTTEASAQAPTAPPVAPQLIEIDGQKYTPEQVKAAFTTREQFKHLQDKYLTAKQKAEAYDKELAERQQPVPAQDPAKVKAMIRANFDPMVKEAVAQGFLEPDFAELYPDLSAQLMMFRDVVTAYGQRIAFGMQKIQEYEQASTQSETQTQNQRILTDARNNIMSLAGEHEALKPLANPEVVGKFMHWLETSVDPDVSRLYDRDFLIAQWVAFNKDTYLQRTQAGLKAQTDQAAARAAARRRAVGDALPGARPGMAPGPTSPLDEMVDEYFSAHR